MEHLAGTVDPEFDSTRVRDGGAIANYDWAAADRVVLLWPDANGVGWSQVEKNVFRRIGSNTRLMVLNGRRRFFELSRGRWLVWRLRRFLDKWFIGDLFALVLLLSIAPVLWAFDRLKGRR
jgi:hypothetical protein